MSRERTVPLAVKTLQTKAEQDMGGGDKWKYDAETGVGKYNWPVDVSCPTVLDWLLQRNFEGTPTNMLDVCGSGILVPPEYLGAVDSITAMRLLNTDARIAKAIADGSVINTSEREKLEASLRFENRKVVTGDIFRDEIWSKLKMSMRWRLIKSFDWIGYRPFGAGVWPFMEGYGLDDQMDAYGDVFVNLLLKLKSVMNPDRGRIMGDIPYVMDYHKPNSSLVSLCSELLERKNQLEGGNAVLTIGADLASFALDMLG